MSPNRNILVAVCGTTGVGKTKLALNIASSLASHYGGAVCLNGDSMQVYKGSDIATNKPTKEERSVCDHLLFDFVDFKPMEEYSVAEFKRDAQTSIQHIHKAGKTPVLVGGTNYYIQSLLWDSNLIIEQNEDKIGLKDKSQVPHIHESLKSHRLKELLSEILSKTDPRFCSQLEIDLYCQSMSLHTILMDIDPVMANKWHPKDFRKIRRSLEIFYTTGITQSEWYKRQKQTLLYPTIMIWLYGKSEELNERLDARVDTMIEHGLVQELKEMRIKVLKNQVIGGAESIDYNRGILQAIGFKEFHNYFEAIESGQHAETIQTEFRKGVEQMKLATRQYARQQVQWIRNKLVPSIIEEHNHEMGAFYLIDATDPSTVTEKIVEDAIKLIKNFMHGEPNSEPTILAPNLSHLLRGIKKETKWELFKCKFCKDKEKGQDRVFTGELTWKKHLASRSHQKQVRYAKNPKPSAGDKDAWLLFQQSRLKS